MERAVEHETPERSPLHNGSLYSRDPQRTQTIKVECIVASRFFYTSLKTFPDKRSLLRRAIAFWDTFDFTDWLTQEVLMSWYTSIQRESFMYLILAKLIRCKTEIICLFSFFTIL